MMVREGREKERKREKKKGKTPRIVSLRMIGGKMRNLSADPVLRLTMRTDFLTRP